MNILSFCGIHKDQIKRLGECRKDFRCIPFKQEHLGDTCACCGKPASKMIYWGVAY